MESETEEKRKPTTTKQKNMIKYKKYIKLICIFALCMLLFALVVTAHSGKTDASGGHYNSSTGEYHYHHGYSAHDHYDMDGDGIKDCPYDFDDKTNRSGSEWTSESTVSPLSWVCWLTVGMVLVACVILFCIRAKNKERAEYEREILSLKEKLRDSENSIKNIEQIFAAQYAKEIDNLRTQNTSLYKQLKESDSEVVRLHQQIQNMEKAPNGITFAEDGMPIFWKKSDDKPYGDYTVFYSSKSRIYHVDRFCAYSARRTHIFKVIGIGFPCKKCAEGFFDFTSVPSWFKKG